MEEIAGLGWNLDFILRFLSIILIDLALSGDNAVVIGMAAASLPRIKRKWAIILGGGLAIILRVTLTIGVTLLMCIPLLCAIGGLVLFWVAWKLFKLDVEDGEKAKVKQTDNFRQAVLLIVTADLIMSLDNVIAVAGTAHGNIALLVIGLLLSMPLLMTVGGVISIFIDKYKWIVYLGAAVIIFTGTRMILEDDYIESLIHFDQATVMALSTFIGVVVSIIFFRLNRRQE